MGACETPYFSAEDKASYTVAQMSIWYSSTLLQVPGVVKDKENSGQEGDSDVQPL